MSGEGLECGETSDSDEESIAHVLLALLTRSRTTFRACVATWGCANFGSAFVLLVKRGNGGGVKLRPTTPGIPVSNYPKSAKALNGNECTCVCDLPGDDANAWVARMRAPTLTISSLEAPLALLLLLMLEMSLFGPFFYFSGFVDTTDFFSTFLKNLT